MNSVERTAEILKLLVDEPRRFTDLAQALDLSKGTAHRLVKALERTELIKKNPVSGRYHLGPLMLRVAASPMAEHQLLITSALEEMRMLRDLSGETVTLQIAWGTERMCLEEVQSTESIKYVSGKGAVYPIYAGSAGKMLLAMMPDRQIEMLMRKFYYVPSAPNPIQNTADLWKEIRIARELGHSTSFGERVAGSASIAVPISEYICPAVLNIMGPVDRFTPNSIASVEEKMKAGAVRISRELSRRGS